MAIRGPEDKQPRDQVEPVQESTWLRYDLVVRLALPYAKRRLVIRCYEDGSASMFIEGPTMVVPGKRP